MSQRLTICNTGESFVEDIKHHRASLLFSFVQSFFILFRLDASGSVRTMPNAIVKRDSNVQGKVATLVSLAIADAKASGQSGKVTVAQESSVYASGSNKPYGEKKKREASC